MTLFRLSSLVRNIIDQLCKKKLWYGGRTVRKEICLVVWKIVCQSKQQEGLGIPKVRLINKSLLYKWFRNSIILMSMTCGKKLLVVNIITEDHYIFLFLYFLKEVNKELDIFKIRINTIIENGQTILFWKDGWILECFLQTQLSLLYDIATDQDLTVTVAQAIGFNIFYLSFIL
jgi:hypothetical protein